MKLKLPFPKGLNLLSRIGLKIRLILYITLLLLAVVGGVSFFTLRSQTSTLKNLFDKVSEVGKKIQTDQTAIVKKVGEQQETKNNAAIKTKLENLSGAVAAAAALALESGDVDVMNQICQGVCGDPDVIFCYLQDSSGKSVTTFTNKSDPDLKKFLEGVGGSSVSVIGQILPTFEDVIKHETPVIQNGKEIGSVTLFASHEEVKRQAKLIQDGADAMNLSLKAALDDFQSMIRQQVDYSQRQGVSLGLSAALISLGAGFVCAVFIARGIVKPLLKAVKVLEDMAKGNLTQQLDVNLKDEVGRMAQALNVTSKAMCRAILAIAQNSEMLSASSEELSAVSQQMTTNSEQAANQAGAVSAAAEQVSKSVQSVSTSTEEMTANVREISKNANQAAVVVSNAVKLAQSANDTVLKLGTSSAEIGNVVKVITSIAEQTKLLALNATIEAARAGEAGKGFAVVANEVKELAKETAKATEDIRCRIESIQSSTSQAVDSISKIAKIIDEISGIATSIASAVEQQTATANGVSRNISEAAKSSLDIARNIVSVAQASKMISSGATGASSSAKDLSKMALELRELVAKFKYMESGPYSGGVKK